MEIVNFKPRAYQKHIAEVCIAKNTLVVLPTGMGKTKTALAALAGRLKEFPNGKVVFLTPTKPLAAQIFQEFLDCTSITSGEAVLLSGDISPEKRTALYAAKVIVSTPQTVANDIVHGRFDLAPVVGLVLDEAHRCVKDYDYTWIAKQYSKVAEYPRIIGLTASPGSDVASIETICKNAFIEAVEVRTEEDVDVAPYVQDIQIDWVKVNLPGPYAAVRVLLQECYKRRFSALRELGVSVNASMSKTELLALMRQLQGRISRGRGDRSAFSAVSVVAQLLKLQHALELLETQGPRSLHSYLEGLFAKQTSKAVKNLVSDLQFCEARNKVEQLVASNVLHPKMGKACDIVRELFASNPSAKVIVFNQYRDNAQRVVELLAPEVGVKPTLFVGQTKKNGTGMSQKEQLATIAAFEQGEVNVLVSTSIGEEGLDIPKVDLIIFYEPVPSAIRSIQRRGRTARDSSGRLVVLMTKNTRDEAYHWVAFHKEKRMHKALGKIRDKLALSDTQEGLDAFVKQKKVSLVADTREHGSSILKHLVDFGVTVESSQLAVGDFILGEGRVGVERKSAKDFVASLLDGRLLGQVRALRESFEKPLLVIEGSEDIYSVRRVHANAIRGALAAVALSFHVPMVFTRDAEDTAAFLAVVAKKEGDASKKDVGMRLERKPLTSSAMQLYIVESLPSVGPSLARALLTHFGSVYGVCCASVDDLMAVEGVGRKKAEEIFGVLRETYSG